MSNNPAQSQTMRIKPLFVIFALGIFIITFFPPVYFQYSVFQWTYIDWPNQSRQISRLVNENMIWFIPLFSKGKPILSLWLAEYIIWFLLTAILILFAASRNHIISVKVAALSLLVFIIGPLFIPLERMSILDEDFKSAPPVITQEIPAGANQALLRLSHAESNLSFSKALSILCSGEPESSHEWVKKDTDYQIIGWSENKPQGNGISMQSVVTSFRLAEIPPLVFCSWVMGIFIAAMIGFLTSGKGDSPKN